MYLIRDIMYCKPGKVRSLVDKLKAMSKLSAGAGMGAMRIMTDFCAEQYWTVVTEVEVPNLEEYFRLSRESMAGSEFKATMQGYHELVDRGRREIYVLES